MDTLVSGYGHCDMQVITCASLGLCDGSLCEGQVEEFLACVLGAAAPTAGAWGRHGDPENRVAWAANGDGPLRSITGDDLLALADQAGGLAGEVVEGWVTAGSPFEVHAQRAHDVIELLLEAALPARVAPSQLFVPVDEPGLEDGDDAAAGYER